MARTAAEALEIDYDDAKDHAAEYIVLLQNQIIKRGDILNGAIQDFNSFLNLPASSNNTLAIFTAAFDLLCTAVPALRLGKFIEAQHARAKNVLSLAEAASQTARRKAVQQVTGSMITIGKAGEHIKEGKEVIEKAAAIPKELEATVEQLKKHAARGPIKMLITELDEGTKLWMNAKKAVKQEWINRLDDLPPKGGTLLGQMQELLPALPATYSDTELEEIWTLYLFFMVTAHCRDNVYWKVTKTNFVNIGVNNEGASLVGLNDSQSKQIIEWFGPMATRGKIFSKFILTVSHFVSQVPIKSTTIQREIRASRGRDA